MTRAIFAWALVAALFFPELAHAQTYVNTTRSEPFVDIGSLPGITGLTALTFSNSDDGQVTVPIPFPFIFLGQPMMEANLGTNGFLTFGNPATALSNQRPGTSAPPNQVIAAIWDDLLHPSPNNARYGVLGSAPNRVLVIEAGPCSRFSSTAGTLYYQFWLFEGPDEKFEYRVTGTPGSSLNATIGWEGVGGMPSHDPLGCAASCGTVPSGTTFSTQVVRWDLTGTLSGLPLGGHPGSTVSGIAVIANAGNTEASSVSSTVYLSLDATLDASDLAVATITTAVSAAGSVMVTFSLIVPVPIAAARYYVLFHADSGLGYVETNEANNVFVSPDRFATAANLVASGITAADAPPAASVTAEIAIDNAVLPYLGSAEAALYVSIDGTLDPTDLALGPYSGTLAGGTGELITGSFTVPDLPPGDYFLIAVVDPANAIFEADELDNTIAVPWTILPISCGDSVLGPGEACDDGNTIDGDGCDSNCTLSACGNGITAGAEQCDGGVCCDSACSFVSATIVCRGASGPCDAVETCSGSSGECPADLLAADGAQCLDGVVCNGSETCAAGTCTPGQGPDCDDGNLCTTDTCTEPGGCGAAPLPGCCNNAADCDDGDACTAGACSGPGGTCTQSPITNCCLGDADCDDNVACTTDACDTATNACVFTAIAGCCGTDSDCDDQNTCTTDTCAGGSCMNALAPGCCFTDGDCADLDPCTRDFCSSPGGRCLNSPRADCCTTNEYCDDGVGCTVETCDPNTNTCRSAPISGCCRADNECDDGDACTTDFCGAGGICMASAISGCCQVDSDCDDFDPCTVDRCTAAGCEHQRLAGCGSDGGVVDGSGNPPLLVEDATGCGCAAQARGSRGTALFGLIFALVLLVRRRS